LQWHFKEQVHKATSCQPIPGPFHLFVAVAVVFFWSHTYTDMVVASGIHDKVRSLVAYPAAYIPLTGRPGSLSFMGLPEDEESAYYSKHPPQKQVGVVYHYSSLLIITALACRGSPVQAVCQAVDQRPVCGIILLLEVFLNGTANPVIAGTLR
jgi:hypothetical protein